MHRKSQQNALYKLSDFHYGRNTLIHKKYYTFDCQPTILADTQALIAAGESAIERDNLGYSPLDLLLFHVGRRLLFDAAKIQSRPAVNSSAWGDNCYKLPPCPPKDGLPVQEQAQEAVKILISHGAVVNRCSHSVPTFLVERLPAQPLRGNRDLDSEYWRSDPRSTLRRYVTNNSQVLPELVEPVDMVHCENNIDFYPLHYAAWRGDAIVIETLIKAGASVNNCTTDGSNALHVLYEFCNLPEELPKATAVLMRAGIDVNKPNCVDKTPLMILVSRSFGALNRRECGPMYAYCKKSKEFNFHESGLSKVIETIELLVAHGADINHATCTGENCFHTLVIAFSYAYQERLDELNSRYQMLSSDFINGCTVANLHLLINVLLKNGFKVVETGPDHDVPLLAFFNILPRLSAGEEPVLTSVMECVNTLLKAGSTINIQTSHGNTVAHLTAMGWTSSQTWDCVGYYNLFTSLIRAGLDVSAINKHGITAVHCLLDLQLNTVNRQWITPEFRRLLLLLFQNGASAGMGRFMTCKHQDRLQVDTSFPLLSLVSDHVTYHTDEQTIENFPGWTPLDALQGYAKTAEVICQCMPWHQLYHAFHFYKCKHEFTAPGFRGVKCLPECPVRAMLYRQMSSPKSLRHICRMSVWKSLQGKGLLEDNVNALKYPASLKDYLIWKI